MHITERRDRRGRLSLLSLKCSRLFSGSFRSSVLRMSSAFANSFGEIELSYCIEAHARAIMSSPLLFFLINALLRISTGPRSSLSQGSSPLLMIYQNRRPQLYCAVPSDCNHEKRQTLTICLEKRIHSRIHTPEPPKGPILPFLHRVSAHNFIFVQVADSRSLRSTKCKRCTLALRHAHLRTTHDTRDHRLERRKNPYAREMRLSSNYTTCSANSILTKDDNRPQSRLTSLSSAG